MNKGSLLLPHALPWMVACLQVLPPVTSLQLPHTWWVISSQPCARSARRLYARISCTLGLKRTFTRPLELAASSALNSSCMSRVGAVASSRTRHMHHADAVACDLQPLRLHRYHVQPFRF